MNIFVLHEDPRIAAQMHCDKHVCKMIVEHAQMMAAAYYHTIGINRKKEFPQNQEKINDLFRGWPRKREDGTEWHYSLSHVNHPCTIWTRTSIENFNWLLECTKALCQEFVVRWKGKDHSIQKILDWIDHNPPKLPSIERTSFARAMPMCYQSDNAIESYRKYYAYKTSYMKVRWKLPSVSPDWWNSDFIESVLESYKPNPA